jgi:hypothetical protein
LWNGIGERAPPVEVGVADGGAAAGSSSPSNTAIAA